MKKINFLLLLFSTLVSAQTGIGTTTPVNKLQIETTPADPASSGSAANGNLRLSGTTGSHVLDFGLSSSSTYSWLQSRSKSAYGTNYNLILNPNGGNVGIGTTNPETKLHSSGGYFRVEHTSPVYIDFKHSGASLNNKIARIGNDNGNMIFDVVNDSYTTPTERMRITSSGNIGIGTTNPVDRLDIRSAMSVNEIKFRGTDGGDDSDPYRLRKFKIGNSNELQLHLNDDSDERFAIYGNSCLTPGCPEYSTHLYHYFRSDGDAYHAGRLGIGTTSPAAPLHVSSSVSQYVYSYGYLNPNSYAGSYVANTNISYSIQADQRIRASEFNAVSDARIKIGIQKQNTLKHLSDLNLLKVVDYSYIDKNVNGSKPKTGFIAQEVESVNPHFVNQSTDFIPSVYDLAKSAKIDTNLLHVITTNPHGFQKGDVVKLFAEGRKEIIKTIEDVRNLNEFSVFGWNEPTENLFVYGKKVNDFRAIDFDQITALSVGAIQELSKQVEKLKLENESLNKRLSNDVQKKQLEFEKRLLELENKLKTKKK